MTFELSKYQGNYLKEAFLVVLVVHSLTIVSGIIQNLINNSIQARGNSTIALDPTKVLIKKQKYIEENIRIKAFLNSSLSSQTKQQQMQHASQIEQSAGKAVESYIGQILQIIEKNKYYPPRDKMYGNEGSPVITMLIDNSGSLKQAELAESSNKPGLDRAALNIVQKAAPYPQFNNLISEDQLNFSVAIEFKLNN
jgi:TonB family protein